MLELIMSTPETPEPSETRREQIRRASAANYARMREMTKLEQAAVKERKLLDADFDPYLDEEREELREIQKLMDQLEARAVRLNQTLIGRLEGEAGRDVGKSNMLERFRKLKGYRLDLPPF